MHKTEKNIRLQSSQKLTHLSSKLQFEKTHLNKEDSFFKHILWSDECKIEFFGRNGATDIWRKNGTPYDMDNIIHTVKHGGANTMIWGCFSLNGGRNARNN